MEKGPIRLRGFTLVELLLATAILIGILLVLTSFLSAVSRAWTAGEQQVAKFQDGRAILELISRELSQAVISPGLQLVQNPTMPAGLNQRANSDSIFWQAPATSTAAGNLAEIGYYLGADYQLRRFFVPPTDGPNYQIFSPPNQPTDRSAPWLSSFVSNTLSAPVSGGVLAFWIRCLDSNGDPIPWLFSNATGAGSLRYNSAAHFQPATLGQAGSFKYTNASSTAQAHLLPTAVEITLVTLDPQSFKRNPSIPALGNPSSATDIPSVRDAFNQQLITNKVKTAQTFTTQVALPNFTR